MRTDIFRPSVIEPSELAFIAFNYLPSEGDVLGNALFLKAERERLNAHMKMTGGRFSSHEHGGSCYCCGAHASYMATFHHAKSNVYIKVGLICAEKLEMGDAEAFRKEVRSALEAGKGKKKAKAVLEAAGLGAAWALREADEKKRTDFHAECVAWREAHPDPKYVSVGAGYEVREVGAPVWKDWPKDELTILDMVERLVKWGSLSDRAMNFLSVLVDRIARKPEIEAKRAAEAAAAAPVPEGRMKMVGEVVSIRLPGEYDPYPTKKWLVKHESGFKIWGSIPAAVVNEVERGDVVEFVATLKRSDKDEKFGFASRPTAARIVKAAKEAA